MFGYQDNLWSTNINGKASLSNMYDAYDLRPKPLKIKQFYSNAIQTFINYEDLTELKKEFAHEVSYDMKRDKE